MDMSSIVQANMSTPACKYSGPERVARSSRCRCSPAITTEWYTHPALEGAAAPL